MMRACNAIDPDITRARTLDPAFYASDEAYAQTRERVFARTWQWLGDLADVAAPGSLSPRTLLAGLLDEPLLVSRDRDGTLQLHVQRVHASGEPARRRPVPREPTFAADTTRAASISPGA